MVKVPIILRYRSGEEVRTWIYVTSYEWGYGTPSFIEKLSYIVSKVIQELIERGYPATLCKPTLPEILRGRPDRRRYIDSNCLHTAYMIIEKVHREMGWDP